MLIINNNNCLAFYKMNHYKHRSSNRLKEIEIYQLFLNFNQLQKTQDFKKNKNKTII